VSSVIEEFVVYHAMRAMSRDWFDERRDRYLLRTDVMQPISLDTTVLPEPMIGDAPWVELLGTAIATPQSTGVAQRWCGGRVFEAVPASQQWKLLGYDVSDDIGTSALMNCAPHSDSEVQRWVKHLNHYHLFEQLVAADDYRAESDLRVPEHAPFYVIGLYAPRSWCEETVKE
jgi:hypothetical protein